MAKRVFDVVFALFGLIVLSPFLLLIAILIKLTSRGPVMFSQERVGRAFAPFRVLKFRTMTHGEAGPSVTARRDPRITSIGRVLRRTKLDELPQLFNVLKGEMSLVGPRPEVRQFVERYRDTYGDILTVRPGITDKASIAFRHEEELLSGADDPEHMYVEEILPQKLELAREYVRRHSLLGDVGIILKTIFHL